MSHIVFQDTILFRYLFSTISRFVDKVHFDIKEEEMRIKSIDPHDFCYLDLVLFNSFFKCYEVKSAISFGVDISKLRSFLPKISDAKEVEFCINDEFLDLIASRDWKITFRMSILEKDPYNLPEPKEINYDSNLIISAIDFSKIIDGASTISSELSILMNGKNFLIRSDSTDYSFIGQPSEILEFNSENKKIESSIITRYLSYLTPLIKRCDRVKIFLGDEKPVRFDLMYENKAVFSFIHSQKRLKTLSLGLESKRNSSLPRLTSSKLPEFLLSLYNNPEGESIRFLKAAGLETNEEFYSRIATKLNLVIQKNGKIHITDEGRLFINLLKNDKNNAKQYLHKLAYKNILEYMILIQSITENPLTPDELFLEMYKKIEEHSKIEIEKDYLNTLLGLAIWCNIVDKKLALYYFKNS